MQDTIGHTALEALKNIVSQISLPFASLLASPFASLGINLLAHAFGVDETNLGKLTETIAQDKESAIKIRQLLLQHETAFAKLQSENYKTEVDDRKSARARESDMAKAGYRDWVPTFLALGFLLNYAGIQFYCVTHVNASTDLISARFQDVLMLIMSYFFGSAYKQSRTTS